MNENENVIDPLDVEVSSVDTSRPVLPGGQLYDLTLRGLVKEPTRDGLGERLTVPLETQQEHVSTSGEKVPPGFLIFHYVGLTPKEASAEGGKTKRAYTMDDIKKGVAAIAKAAGYSGKVSDIVKNPGVLEGRTVRVKLGINKATNDFPESNRVQEFIPLK